MTTEPATNDLTTTAPRAAFALPLLISLGITTLMALGSAWVWSQLAADARIPMHWNAAGKIDGYGSRHTVFLLPGVALGLSLLFALLPRLEPRRNHLLRSFPAYRAVWLAVLALFAGLHVILLLSALGRNMPMDRLVWIGLGALFAIIGNYLGKVRSNFFFGVRTPWTLSSELSWNKTHRLAGWMFTVFGLALIILGVTANPGRIDLRLILVFGVVLLLTVLGYSYAVWRSDPNKILPDNAQ